MLPPRSCRRRDALQCVAFPWKAETTPQLSGASVQSGEIEETQSALTLHILFLFEQLRKSQHFCVGLLSPLLCCPGTLLCRFLPFLLFLWWSSFLSFVYTQRSKSHSWWWKGWGVGGWGGSRCWMCLVQQVLLLCFHQGLVGKCNGGTVNVLVFTPSGGLGHQHAERSGGDSGFWANQRLHTCEGTARYISNNAAMCMKITFFCLPLW